ncbi:MAG: SDR family NAD(P)-dependent oxidoreductase, partial [Betaproteobacteria bacterium AqS2]|nr:SDR family NAD(P)-dependent oxidoreductase [Betaproteobacteria bacterium AqS2]
MSDKTVLITGGMGGLGTELCRLLHGQGYKVATTYIHDHGREQRWKEERAAEGYEGIEVFECDVKDWDACVAMAEKVRD